MLDEGCQVTPGLFGLGPVATIFPEAILGELIFNRALGNDPARGSRALSGSAATDSQALFSVEAEGSCSLFFFFLPRQGFSV